MVRIFIADAALHAWFWGEASRARVESPTNLSKLQQRLAVPSTFSKTSRPHTSATVWSDSLCPPHAATNESGSACRHRYPTGIRARSHTPKGYRVYVITRRSVVTTSSVSFDARLSESVQRRPSEWRGTSPEVTNTPAPMHDNLSEQIVRLAPSALQSDTDSITTNDPADTHPICTRGLVIRAHTGASWADAMHRADADLTTDPGTLISRPRGHPLQITRGMPRPAVTYRSSTFWSLLCQRKHGFLKPPALT